MILKRGGLLIDLKYASRITVKDGYVIVKLVDSEDVVKMDYSKDWTTEVLTAIILIRKNEDGFYIDLGGERGGDSGKAD
jgi:hypothetical protein